MTAVPTQYSFRSSAKVNSQPLFDGYIKQRIDDFVVREQLGFSLSGFGEHVYILIEKKGLSTGYVREQLAKFSQRHLRDIGYSGLKDRHAVTTQWLSVYAPGDDSVNWAGFPQFVERELNGKISSLAVMEVVRHSKKLRVGAHTTNDFEIVLRPHTANGLTFGEYPERILKSVVRRLSELEKIGFPNYFGEQRFGVHGGNVFYALELFRGDRRAAKKQRGFFVSAARSFLFNELLSSRVAENNWSTYIDGDVLMLDGSQSIFGVDSLIGSELESEVASVKNRLAIRDVHVSGMQYGENYTPLRGRAGELERGIIDRYSDLAVGIVNEGVESSRRSFRIFPKNCDVDWHNDGVRLHFSLPKGGFATTMLREIVDYTDYTMMPSE